MPASAQPPQSSFSECWQAYCCSYRYDLTAANLPRRHNTNRRRQRKSRTGVDPSGSPSVVDGLVNKVKQLDLATGDIEGTFWAARSSAAPR
jgi:hypothetical protein